MSKLNFTWKEIKDKIVAELDIANLLDTIFDKDKPLWHPDAPINEYLKNGGAFDFNVKTSYTLVVCPLHETESADSTFYYHEKNRLMCKTGGCRSNEKLLNPIDLYMVLVKNVSPDLLAESNEEFKETFQELAEMIGITSWSYESRTLTEEEIKAIRKQKIRQEVAEVYHSEFRKKTIYARKAREFFFYERGFGQLGFSVRSLIRSQKLGYAGGKYGSKYVYHIMKKRGYTDEELIHAGVVQFKKVHNNATGKSEATEEIVDFLTNRFTIPYKKGKKIDHGYGRRIEFKSEMEKSFARMTEAQIKKSKSGKHLRFGGGVDEPINFQEAKKHESIIFVEGEMDWLTFLALEFNNVVATGGTNGVDQADINLLKYNREISGGSLCQIIYLCFDEDGPGQAAMQKLGAKFLAEDFDVRVVRLKEGDPNDYLKNYGKEAKGKLATLLEEAISFEAFLVLNILKKAKLTTNAEVKGALVKARAFLGKVEPAELLFIAGDIVQEINAKRPTEQAIPLTWLLHVWNLVPDLQVLEPVGFDTAVLKPWVLVTEDKARYNALLANGTLDNMIYVPDMETFAKKITQQAHIKNIALDIALSDTSKQYLLDTLPDFKYQLFIGKSVEEIQSATKYELVSMFRKTEDLDEKIS